MPIIEVDHVTKEFRLGQLTSLGQSLRNGVERLLGKRVAGRAPFKALDDVSFSAEPGEVLGIIGHNGAGKSTMLKILAGISQPTMGKISVRGRVSPLIEVGAGLVPDMTGRENVFLNASILGMKRAEINRKFDEIVAFAELEEFIDTPIKRYSSGMQVRLGFAIATAVDSEILIVDEVLAVGDLAFQRKCFDRMQQIILSEGRTVLLVSHNIRQIERICTRVLLLNHGRIDMDDAPKTVCNAFYEVMDQQVQRTIGDGNASRKNLECTNQVRLIRLCLLDADGTPVESIEFAADAMIALTFEAIEELRHPIFAVGIHTGDFLYLTTPRSVGRISKERLAPGVYEVRCRLPRLSIVPGVYALRASISEGEISSTILYIENASHFRIDAPSLERSMVASEGLFVIDADWALRAGHTPPGREARLAGAAT